MPVKATTAPKKGHPLTGQPPTGIEGSTGSYYANDSGTRTPLPDEQWGSSGIVPMAFNEEGPDAGNAPGNSTRVGFTLRDSENRVIDAFAFRINPQGLSYAMGSRAQLAAVKSGMYVDDFGPGASVITMRQLVVQGKNAYLDGPYYTGREDVQRFLKTIFLPATAGLGKTRRRAFFHDHHFEKGFEQRIFFPPNAMTIERGVDQPGIWRVELQMISLEKYPYSEVEAEKTPDASGVGKPYRVKRGDTLEKLARKLAGKNAPTLKRKIIQIRLLELNPQLRKLRRVPGDSANEKSGKPFRLYPGELLAIPA